MPPYGKAPSPRSFSSPSRRRIAFSVGVGATPRANNAPSNVQSPPKRKTQPTPVFPRYVVPPVELTSAPSTIRKIALVTRAT